jgi:hypothetical protein
MKHERNNLMKHSLEKWGRAPIILGGLEHPLFWGLEHPFSRRARALTIQRGTSTHCLKNSQTENKWANAKWTWKQISSWNALLKKWGRAPIIFEGSSTHLFEGSSTHFLVGHEHSLFKEQSNGERVSKCKMNHERRKVHEMLSWKMGARTHYFWGLEHPSFGGSSTHLLGGHEHSPLREHSIREQMNEHTWI